MGAGALEIDWCLVYVVHASQGMVLASAQDPVDLDVERGIRELKRVVPDVCANTERMVNELRNERIRIITVSRARYNPRFRGRLIVTGHAARKMLPHATLCVGSSEAVAKRNLSRIFT